ncbi:MAG: YifB family Mg chelatase-like AAA ATPase [Nitrospiraceae bacterium]|nr:YifB family Mg chelatase-like AAA ATPase [Nitrospiraceae bacterium]
MLSRVRSASLYGIEAHPIDVEVDIASRGLPHFYIVGLPDASVKESRDRVRAALKNTGFSFPLRPVTINMAPADLKKEGSSFDLPIAIGLTAAEGLLEESLLADYLIMGELSLDGKIKPVKGSLSVAMLARKTNARLILPMENGPEAAVVAGVTVLGADSLPEVIEFLRGTGQLKEFKADGGKKPSLAQAGRYDEDFSDVKGQEHAKRALEVAASGGHNALMIGPPGAGKTMLSRRLPGILPPITFEEALETTRVHSVAGLLKDGKALLDTRPFRTPHHTVSDVALVGGGQFPHPGEVSLAHNGVLFLDELPEFKRSVLEVLRQPLENGEVTVSRAQASVTFPARFMLVSAMNPCPCGYLGDDRHQCTCSPGAVTRYRARVSGPLLDRIDIHIEVPAVAYKDLSSDHPGEGSADIRERVMKARLRQLDRFHGENIYANGQMKTRHIKKFCRLNGPAQGLMETASQKLALSARAYTRVLKLSRTIADMDGQEDIGPQHLSEAIQYRSLDRVL